MTRPAPVRLSAICWLVVLVALIVFCLPIATESGALSIVVPHPIAVLLVEVPLIVAALKVPHCALLGEIAVLLF